MSINERHKVRIRCNLCGEKFTLVGKRAKSGEVETGFKQCLCNNDRDFQVSEIEYL
ncbi:hypothetical protein [Ammoniphilus sp. YIM 78166]|uniref:hypothetical protein n=1 Tax=Ammoniphilus sp. YIM 78166 TaxID=1644106 RepID=UPI00143147B8|nr:hypothetical protein [Ammoniphilus sp. YIM 78166]